MRLIPSAVASLVLLIRLAAATIRWPVDCNSLIVESSSDRMLLANATSAGPVAKPSFPSVAGWAESNSANSPARASPASFSMMAPAFLTPDGLMSIRSVISCLPYLLSSLAAAARKPAPINSVVGRRRCIDDGHNAIQRQPSGDDEHGQCDQNQPCRWRTPCPPGHDRRTRKYRENDCQSPEKCCRRKRLEVATTSLHGLLHPNVAFVL